MKQAYKNWLQNLGPGDEVFIRYQSGHLKRKKVSSIFYTANGDEIIMKSGTLCSYNRLTGRSNHSRKGSHSWLIQSTPGVVTEYEYLSARTKRKRRIK